MFGNDKGILFDKCFLFVDVHSMLTTIVPNTTLNSSYYLRSQGEWHF